jgi:hypothetical protein
MTGLWRWPVSLAAFAAILAVPVVNWYAARDHADAGTLRWCVVAKRPVVRGARIADEDVGLTMRRLSADTCVADIRRVKGKYASAQLDAGKLVSSGNIVDLAPAAVPANGAAVPIEVKSEHAASVQPGTRLIFVREKDKRTTTIPARSGKGAKRKLRGLEVISVAVSGKDGAVTTLMVAVEASDISLIPALATGQWRPVIISNP